MRRSAIALLLCVLAGIMPPTVLGKAPARKTSDALPRDDVRLDLFGDSTVPLSPDALAQRRTEIGRYGWVPFHVGGFSKGPAASNPSLLLLDGKAESAKLKSSASRGKVRARLAATRKFLARPKGRAAVWRAGRTGLDVPRRLDDSRPLVVLIHGMDTDNSCWGDLAGLLVKEGFQVGYFSYPNDQSIAESGQLLTNEMSDLRKNHAKLPVHLVTHSMGGLVARWYVEGNNYQGGIRRLIMLAPPNHGSCYARGRFLAEAYEHCRAWFQSPHWNWTCCLDDGHGEAAAELKPGSEFLAELNARPRRKGVRYTIVAGNLNCGWRYTASGLTLAAQAVPDWKWAGTMRSGIESAAKELRNVRGSSDGLVKLESAKLAGVRDLVLVPADHSTIFHVRGGSPPRAWETIKSRLAR